MNLFGPPEVVISSLRTRRGRITDARSRGNARLAWILATAALLGILAINAFVYFRQQAPSSHGGSGENPAATDAAKPPDTPDNGQQPPTDDPVVPAWDGRAATGLSDSLPFKYYYTGRKPVMHPSGTGNIHTELVDGIVSGTGQRHWEGVLFPQAIDDLRILIQWAEPSFIQDIVVHFTNPYKDYGFSTVAVFVSTDGSHFRRLDVIPLEAQEGPGSLTIPVGLLVPQIELVFQNRNYWRSILLNEISVTGYPLGRTDFPAIRRLYKAVTTTLSGLPVDDSFARDRLLTGLDYVQQEEYNAFRLLNIPTHTYHESSLDTFYRVREVAESLNPGSEQLTDRQFIDLWLSYVENNVDVEEFDEWNVLNFLTTGRTACGISAQFTGFLKAFGFSTARRIGWQSIDLAEKYWKGFTEVSFDSGWHLVDFAEFRILDESVFGFYESYSGRKAPIEFDVYPPFANYFLARGIETQELSEEHRLLLSAGRIDIEASDFPPLRPMW